MTVPFPWQTEQWRRLWEAKRADHLAHALLLSGPEGSGISEFAKGLAASFVCDRPLDDGTACDGCRGCLLYHAGNHPEIRLVVKDAESNVIKIDQVRDIMQFVGLKSHYRHLKIVVIDPADAMNRHAAHSLLKTLEEPPPQTLFMLVCSSPACLPITLRSRCQQVRFGRPSTTATRDWLRTRRTSEIDTELLLVLTDNGPLAALDMVKSGFISERQGLVADLEQLRSGTSDPVAIAERWSKLGEKELVPWLLKMIGDLIKLKSVSEPPRIANPDLRGRLQALADRLNLLEMFSAYDRLLEYRRMLDRQSAVTRLNLLEEFTIKWLYGNRSKPR